MRKFEVLSNDEWVEIPFEEIESGYIIRVHDTDGSYQGTHRVIRCYPDAEILETERIITERWKKSDA